MQMLPCEVTDMHLGCTSGARRLLHDLDKLEASRRFWAERLAAGQHRAFLLLARGPTSFAREVLGLLRGPRHAAARRWLRQADEDGAALTASDQIERRVFVLGMLRERLCAALARVDAGAAGLAAAVEPHLAAAAPVVATNRMPGPDPASNPGSGGVSGGSDGGGRDGGDGRGVSGGEEGAAGGGSEQGGGNGAPPRHAQDDRQASAPAPASDACGGKCVLSFSKSLLSLLSCLPSPRPVRVWHRLQGWMHSKGWRGWPVITFCGKCMQGARCGSTRGCRAACAAGGGGGSSRRVCKQHC